jgi:hypothetical protein
MKSRRKNRLVTAITVLSLGAGVAASGAASAASVDHSATSPALLSCANTVVSKPRTFIISCGDGNSELTTTTWTSWTATRAVGKTTFGLNLCVPYCAASKMTFFSNSTVTLTAPERTKHGVLYSDLVVSYVLHGTKKSFALSWKGSTGYAS